MRRARARAVALALLLPPTLLDAAGRLRPKVAGPDASTGDERFLELLVAVKAARR